MTRYYYDDDDSSSSSSFVSSSFFEYYSRIGIRDLLEINNSCNTTTSSSNSNSDLILTPRQLETNEWVPRIAGVISVVSALCMLIMAWKRRDRLFHRLILGKLYSSSYMIFFVVLMLLLILMLMLYCYGA